jgi:4-diphosphocytidyl-2-C-methyl-D-erythritol kinase
MEKVHLEHGYAKLTRSLRVVGRRPDGMHLIEAEMLTVGLADDLEFSPAASCSIEVIDASGHDGAGDLAAGVPRDEANLVIRALQLADRPAAVVLRKRIPAGAGLGGGSADAAAALRFAACQDLDVAAALGADVPFCLRGGRAEVSGVGEILHHLSTLELTFVVLSPAFAVSTAAVYRAYDALWPTIPNARQAAYANDLESAALAVEPRLARYRELFTEAVGTRPKLLQVGSTSAYRFRRSTRPNMRVPGASRG